jgi:hypothetical protein
MATGYRPEDQDFIRACVEMTDDDLFYGFTPGYVQQTIPSFILQHPGCTIPLPCPPYLDAQSKELWETITFIKTRFLTKRGESTVSATNDDGSSTAFAFVSQPLSPQQAQSVSPEQCAANVAALVAAETSSNAPGVLEVATKHEAEVYGPVYTKNLATQTATITAQQSAEKSAKVIAENEAMTKPKTAITKSVSVAVQNTATVAVRVREDGQILFFTETVSVSATATHTAIFRGPHRRTPMSRK